MNTQPEALRLADELDGPYGDLTMALADEAAAELRRLHELNQELFLALRLAMPALEAMRKQWPRSPHDDSIDVVKFARAAIAKAQGE